MGQVTRQQQELVRETGDLGLVRLDPVRLGLGLEVRHGLRESQGAERQAPQPEKAPERKLAEQPQTGYGKAVKKAKDAAAAHDKNVLKPNDEVLKEP